MKVTTLINIYYSFGGGGIETMISNLSCEARSLGIKSHLIIIGKELGRVNSSDYDSINLINGKLSGRKLANTIKTTCEELCKYDNSNAKVLIHSPGLWAIFFKYKNTEVVIHSIPTLVTSQRGIAAAIRKRLMSLVYQSHKVVAVSKGVADNLKEQYHLNDQNLRIIYNGINYNKLKNLSEVNISLPKQKFIVFVARLVPLKQHDHLLRAIAMLEDKPTVLILGAGEKAYLENLKLLVTKLKLTNLVNFMGHVNNPYPYIKNAELLVLCSKTEACPMILIESLMLHTPIVSYRSPTGPVEILNEKNPESLVELNNIPELSKAIQSALTKPTTIDKEFYINKYNITTTLKQLLEC